MGISELFPLLIKHDVSFSIMSCTRIFSRKDNVPPSHAPFQCHSNSNYHFCSTYTLFSIHVPITLRLCYIHITINTWPSLQCTYDQTYIYTAYVCKHMSSYRHTNIIISTSCKISRTVKWYYYQFWLLISKTIRESGVGYKTVKSLVKWYYYQFWILISKTTRKSCGGYKILCSLPKFASST